VSGIAVYGDMQGDDNLNLRQHPAAGVDGLRRRPPGHLRAMRFGNVEIRPLGGGFGCLLMLLFSVVASVVLTVLVNLILR
jgi:hypothetical protein